MEPLDLPVKGAEILDKHGQTIEKMRSQDASFQDLWNDYTEVAHAIVSGGLNDRDEVELGRLRAALEADIFESLSLFQGHPGGLTPELLEKQPETWIPKPTRRN